MKITPFLFGRLKILFYICSIIKTNNMNLVDEIIQNLNAKFNGKLDCEEQRADLFVYINGNEETIKAVDTERIYFENDEHDVDLYDANIQHLVYINNIIK